MTMETRSLNFLDIDDFSLSCDVRNQFLEFPEVTWLMFIEIILVATSLFSCWFCFYQGILLVLQ